jgi:hypothetical protein
MKYQRRAEQRHLHPEERTLVGLKSLRRKYQRPGDEQNRKARKGERPHLLRDSRCRLPHKAEVHQAQVHDKQRSGQHGQAHQMKRLRESD